MKNLIPLLKSYYIIPSFLIIVLIYRITLAPSVVEIDSGELAAVQSLLGVAHPTGYPLFTLLGYLFLKIPLSGSRIFQLNLLAMIFCIIGLWFFYCSIRMILLQMRADSITNKRKGSAKNIDYIVIAASTLSLFLLGFSKTFWLQSTSVEVYSLHIFLMNSIIYFILKADFESNKYWIWAAFFLALGFSNHMTTILILPGLIYLFIAKLKFRSSTLRIASLMAVVFFVTVIVIYSYLPIRASKAPVLNWGDPSNLKNLIRHVTGKQYRVWLFSSAEAAMKNLNYFFKNFLNEFNWIGILSGFAGLYYTLFKKRRLGIFFILTFVLTVLYSVNYDIHDLDSYFILAYIVFAFMIGSGIYWVLHVRGKLFFILFSILIFLSIPYQIMNNFQRVDRSRDFVFEDYTKQALESMPENSLLISYQWDYLVSPSYYFRFVENFRRDVAVVDKELLRRSWYYKQIERNYPQIIVGIKPKIISFLKALKPFEEGEEFDPRLLERLYRGLIAGLIDTNVDKRAVFLGPELVQNELVKGHIYLPAGVRLIPDLFFYRVVRTDVYHPMRHNSISIRFPERVDYYSDMIRRFVSNMVVLRMRYEIRHGRIEIAKGLKKDFKLHFSGVRLPPDLEAL